MSKKAFQQLMTDSRRVGSQVVYASSTRLLLQTSKQDVGNAYAYSQYILKSIQQKPLFHFLGLEIKEYWDFLVWYDLHNYGGKGTPQVDENTSSDNLQIIMHWQLSQFLPLSLQPIFEDWVVEFIELMHCLKRPGLSDSQDPATPRQTQLPSTFTSLTEDPASTVVTTILKDDYSKPLKKQITALIRRQHDELLHPELQSDWTFPVHAGGSLQETNSRNTRNPVLELVKALMQVLSLSKPLQLETRLLRKELLALFDVREFSTEARFENPSASLMFENLICNTCTMTRDLDLCRDEDILPSMPGPNGEVPADKPWRCPSCNSEYNRIALEEKLISRLEAQILMWQIQDLKCKKCGRIQGDIGMFGEHCTCGGSWEGTVQRNTIKKSLGVMERVAHAYELKMLDWVVKGVNGAL